MLSQNRIYLKLLIIFFALVAANLLYFSSPSLKSNVSVLIKPSTSSRLSKSSQIRNQTEFHCYLESWNTVQTDKVPFEDIHRQWVRENVSRRDNIIGSEVRLLTAFVYETHIAVTTTSQKSFGEKAYCRYYDCEQKEIPSSAYSSFFFPMNVVQCPRRIGAKYMSISSNLTETPQQPIPLIFRAFPAPMHDISVCVGPMYGDEKKWLEVAEFVEHYKLLGVRHFYFTIFNMNEYSRKIMDEYLRTGEIELTVIQSEYENVDWQFHLLQINECHMRAKYHSKWVINVDIDERLIVFNETIQEIVRGFNDTVSEIGFGIQRIQKTEPLPQKYIDDGQIVSEMEFLKYNMSAEMTWAAFKSMYRPDRTGSMYYHWSYSRYPGNVVGYVNTDRAVIRHYRTIENKGLGGGWVDKYGNFSVVPTEPKFAEKLKNNVLKKIKYVYDQRILYCEEIPEAAYKEYINFGHELFHCVFRNETGHSVS